jgi:hypothetical protein
MPRGIYRRATADERFFGSFRIGPIPQTRPDLGACWLWTAAKVYGYGKFRFDGRQWRAHRWAYTRFVGPIPEGLTIDHLCCVKGCVNPRHLEPVTNRENNARCPTSPATINRNKTHCNRGHEFNYTNTRLIKGGGRACRKCDSFCRMRKRKTISALGRWYAD